MSQNDSRELNQYLKSCGILIGDSLKEGVSREPLSEQRVSEHLALISEFHKRTMGLSGFPGGRLENSTGKKIEQFKVYLKKLKRDVKRLKTSVNLSDFEELVMIKAPENLERAELCIKEIYDNRYFKLIERSMKRNEVCLGDTDIDNLIKDEFIKVRSTKKFCYNMVECDAIYFLNKVKKRSGSSAVIKTGIKEFCSSESLDENSERFILASLSYPTEFMKVCERHRSGRKDWNENEYIERLISAIEKDGEFLL